MTALLDEVLRFRRPVKDVLEGLRIHLGKDGEDAAGDGGVEFVLGPTVDCCLSGSGMGASQVLPRTARRRGVNRCNTLRRAVAGVGVAGVPLPPWQSSRRVAAAKW